ncbi:unnamed protein product [Medioppia subpectinata]|uniref:UBC core domain-containing protein n=1 Tax=Medioppia subpectinata TaxID=1979941 RepID=A0A7R9KCF4_9ACAR|nr:unnamed protein product [Medioppia subpectinata]CAG2100535.1 unnamed protein product [Medioppia subpectinata]
MMKRLLKELQQVKEEKDFKMDAVVHKDSRGVEDWSKWDVYVTGAQGSIYEGHVLHAKMTFPSRYPNLPPTFTFVTKMFHPNVYSNGKVCISILHTANDNPYDSYAANYSWTAVQTVRTVCISIISLLADPNIKSPANIDASNMFRDHKEEYEEKVREMLEKYAKKEADEGQVTIVQKE